MTEPHKAEQLSEQDVLLRDSMIHHISAFLAENEENLPKLSAEHFKLGLEDENPEELQRIYVEYGGRHHTKILDTLKNPNASLEEVEKIYRAFKKVSSSELTYERKEMREYYRKLITTDADVLELAGVSGMDREEIARIVSDENATIEEMQEICAGLEALEQARIEKQTGATVMK